MHSKWPRWAVVAGLVWVAGPLHAQSYALKQLKIDHPYARATPPGARAGGVYFSIENAGKEADRLVGVSSPAAANVEVHTTSMDGNIMRMRAISNLDVPAGGKLTLKSGGIHVMLLDLKQPLVAGAKIPLLLTFEKAGTIEVSVAVEAMGYVHQQK